MLATAGVGDGRPATEVPVGAANDLATDGAGNVYIAGAARGRVRKVGIDGVMTTILNAHDAGTGADAIRSTTAVAVDQNGERVYVADMVGNRVWVIVNGVAHVLAGTGMQGSRGDGGAAVAAELSLPADVAVGPDRTVYVADMGNHVVRAISLQGIIRTVAGDRPESELNAPLAVTVGADGAVYIADHRGDRVVAVAGDGSVRRFSSPGSCCAVDSLASSGAGDLFATAAGMLWRKTPTGWQEISAGSSTAHDFDAVSILRGALLAVDRRAHTVVRVDPDGTLVALAGNGTFASFGDGGPADGASFACRDLAVTPDGSIVLSDSLNNRVAVIRPDAIIHTLAGGGKPGFAGDGGPATAALLSQPAGIALGQDGAVYVADSGNNRVRRIDVNGTITTVAGSGLDSFSGDGGPATRAALNLPLGVAVGRAGELYIADSSNRRVRRVDLATGVISTVASLDMFPASLVVGEGDTLLVTDRAGTSAIRLEVEDGEVEPFAADLETEPPLPASVLPVPLARDARGRLLVVAGDRLLIGPGEGDGRKKEKGHARHARKGEDEGRGRDAFHSYRLADGGRPVRGITSIAVGRNGDLFLCDAGARRILRVAGTDLSGDARE